MKKMTDVRIYGDPVLRRAAKKVDAINEEIKEMIPVLVKTMQTEDGVGLAANQIGITERVIAVSDGTQVFVIIRKR